MKQTLVYWDPSEHLLPAFTADRVRAVGSLSTQAGCLVAKHESSEFEEARHRPDDRRRPRGADQEEYTAGHQILLPDRRSSRGRLSANCS
jgi:hypothetical protein